MKTKSTEMKQETEKRFKKYISHENVPYVGCPLIQTEGFSEEYKQIFQSFERKLIAELSNLVRMQNAVYYQMKTHDAATSQTDDSFKDIDKKNSELSSVQRLKYTTS